jgi:hypothetical protein
MLSSPRTLAWALLPALAAAPGARVAAWDRRHLPAVGGDLRPAGAASDLGVQETLSALNYVQ